MPPAARALPRQELAILPVCVGGGCPLPFNPLGLATAFHVQGGSSSAPLSATDPLCPRCRGSGLSSSCVEPSLLCWLPCATAAQDHLLVQSSSYGLKFPPSLL